MQKSGWNYASALAGKIWADFWNNPGATNQEHSFPIPGKVLMESLYQLPRWRVSQVILQKHICTITIISTSKLLHLPLASSQPGAADGNSFLWCCWSLSSHICTVWTVRFELLSTFWIKNCNFPSSMSAELSSQCSLSSFDLLLHTSLRCWRNFWLYLGLSQVGMRPGEKKPTQNFKIETSGSCHKSFKELERL